MGASSADGKAIRALQRIAIQRASSSVKTSAVSSTTATSRQVTAPVQPKPPDPTVEFEVVTVDAKGTITDRRRSQAECRQEDLGNGVQLSLVRIPAGQFQMGSPTTEEKRDDEEGPQHGVNVPGFLMGQYPVTQAQWRVVAALPKIEKDLDSDPSRFKGK